MEAFITSLAESAREYGLSRLSEESSISRSQIHRILHGKNTSIETLERLLDVLGFSLRLEKKAESTFSLCDKRSLEFALAIHGAPLLTENENEFRGQKIPSKTMTLIAALKAGRWDSRINSILPFFIHKNWDDIDISELKRAEIDRRYLSYQLDLLYRLTNNLDYVEAIGNFRPRKKTLPKQVLIKGRKRNAIQNRIFSRTENGAATAWGYKTSDSFNDIEARFRKWCSVAV